MSYSPTLGRFLEQDPIGYVDGPNLYEYVGSNPIARVDPLGLAFVITTNPGNSYGGHSAIMVQKPDGSWVVYSNQTGDGDKGGGGGWAEYTTGGYFFERYDPAKDFHVLQKLPDSFRDADIAAEIDRRMKEDKDNHWGKGGEVCSSNLVDVLLDIALDQKNKVYETLLEWVSKAGAPRPDSIMDRLDKCGCEKTQVGVPAGGGGGSSSSSSSWK